MARALRHRGPDGQGVWVDDERGIALGHRRLSILDLSETGRQPMHSRCERYVLAFNGEIYNHLELRKRLLGEGGTFRGTSDSEVLLEACASWSLSRTLSRLEGMFAFALWDRAEQALVLARDRLGIKPLYWAELEGAFVFGSELKALREYPYWSPRIRIDAVAAFMRHGYIPSPATIYEGVYKLEAGSTLTVGLQRASPRIVRYWDLADVAARGKSEREGASSPEFVDELEALLTNAIGRHLVADVPVGAFLSGGIDSSTVAAIAQAQSPQPIKTYCIGFEQMEFNEAPYARTVAQHLGTDHTELFVSAQDALNQVPELPRWYDEPFADSSQVPTLLLASLTRKDVTVALSGDGGDELFAGYDRYFWSSSLSAGMRHIPRTLRRVASFGLHALSPCLRDDRLDRLRRVLPRGITASRVAKLAEVLQVDNDDDALYREILSIWSKPSDVVRSGREAKGLLWQIDKMAGIRSPIERMQFMDTLTYLPDDILTKVDRASMAVGLEARVPLIDHRVVEFAWRLPLDLKVREGKGKWILRAVLERHVPTVLTNRPKRGFGIPLAAWLRGPLRGWAEDLLSPDALANRGLLDVGVVRAAWHDHLAHRRNFSYHLWPILMLQSWLELWH